MFQNDKHRKKKFFYKIIDPKYHVIVIIRVYVKFSIYFEIVARALARVDVKLGPSDVVCQILMYRWIMLSFQ